MRESKRVHPPLVICGHVHETHREENLIFDEVDSTWERIMETNGSSGGLLAMAFRIYRWNMSKVGLTNDRRRTYLVSAAVVDGGWYPKGAYLILSCDLLGIGLRSRGIFGWHSKSIAIRKTRGIPPQSSLTLTLLHKILGVSCPVSSFRESGPSLLNDWNSEFFIFVIDHPRPAALMHTVSMIVVFPGTPPLEISEA